MTQQRTNTRISAKLPGKALSRKLSLTQRRALILKGGIKRDLKGVSRRQFLTTAAAAGATLALVPRLEAAHGKKLELRTLFFNFSHEDHGGHTYYLVLGKHRFRLEAADPSHPALLRASQTNKVLQALPAGTITHVLENVQLPSDQVLLGYTIKDADTTTGTWAMSSIYLQVPKSSINHAYTQARKNLVEGAPLPLSAKRMKYGLVPAVNLQDVLDELDVLDSTDWAKAMVNVHPEMLSAEPNSAAHIQNNLIDPRSTFQLSQQLELAGPALPQQSATPDNSTNASGWATLVPYTDDDGVTPLKNTNGNNKGLILYDARWQPNTKTFVGAALKPTSSNVKNDTTLGTDVTGGPTSLTAGNLNGAIWFRKDAITSVNQSPGVLSTVRSSSEADYTLSNITPDYGGYSLSADTSVSSDGANVTLNFANWYLRWLGLYAQFVDANGQPVPLDKVPNNVSKDSQIDLPAGFVFLGVLTPEFTIYGIPIQQSNYTYTFPFPTQVASSANILASGLGGGSHTYQDTETLGVVFTTVFNLLLPPLLLAIGLGTKIDLCYKLVIFPAITLVLQEFSTLGGSQAQIINVFVRALAKWATNPTGPFKLFLEQYLIPWLAGEEAETIIEDSIAIVGTILQVMSVVAVGAELFETTLEVAASPWTYAYNLALTHDLSVTLKPDPTDPGGFPAAASTYTLKAIFDNGTPHVQTLNMPGETVQSLPPVVFQNVPLGSGDVTVSVAFYTNDGTQVGHGTTSVTNDVNANPTITITEDLLPITAATVYMHKQKTTLDAQGNHVWVCAPAPAAGAAACEASPGNLCSFRNITVSSLGYIGYGWQSYNSAGCAFGGAGQLDQMANIFVSNDSSGNAQAGYAFTPCALQPGTKLVYDPLGRPGANYYVDLSNGNNLIRQIQLNPPAFADPRANNAWGMFNLNSDDLLLHPAGALVSINSNTSRMESLRLPAASVSDAEAAVSHLANLHGGLGSRPGLFNTPTVSTITSDGVVLILESGNNRIHAVDLAANPVRHFKNQPTQYFLNFSATGGSNTQYLDMAVEFSGFIYVLSYSNSVYRLDIYQPDQTGTNPISTTMGFNAAKVTVDYWRNVYSLNQEVLMLPDGSLPNGVTEPSISQWIPAAPPPCQAQPALTRQQSKRQQLAVIPSPRRPLRRRDFWRAWV